MLCCLFLFFRYFLFAFFSSQASSSFRSSPRLPYPSCISNCCLSRLAIVSLELLTVTRYIPAAAFVSILTRDIIWPEEVWTVPAATKLFVLGSTPCNSWRRNPVDKTFVTQEMSMGLGDLMMVCWERLLASSCFQCWKKSGALRGRNSVNLEKMIGKRTWKLICLPAALEGEKEREEKRRDSNQYWSKIYGMNRTGWEKAGESGREAKSERGIAYLKATCKMGVSLASPDKQFMVINCWTWVWGLSTFPTGAALIFKCKQER